MISEAYERLRHQAQRWRRSTDDADDLLQDALVSALAAQREPLVKLADERWLYGVIRKLAAMDTRTRSRRRVREGCWAQTLASEHSAMPELSVPIGRLVGSLTPAERSVATLALHGLGPDEIRWILDLSAPAFRQRLVAIRRAIGRLPSELRSDALASALHRPAAPGLDLRLIRDALRSHLGRRPGIGTHDPDGHLLVFAHKSCSGGNV